MNIKKYDEDFSRRHFLKSVSTGVLAAGVLSPLWPLIAKAGEISKAYPDELLDIGMFTKGKIKTGDIITADNVELVKDLLDPIQYTQVSQMGRRIKIVKTTTDITKMFPHEYLEATLRNNGQAKFDSSGNVVTKDGNRWIGGNPFPDPKTAAEIHSNLCLSWGRHDQSLYAIRDWEIGPDGGEQYQYDFVWAEMNAAGLVNNPDGPYLAGEAHQDKLRHQAIWFTHPNDVKGSSFLNTWYYDQRKLPDLSGYLPAFKRVRRFPSNQRFEPLLPGMTFFLSDAWASGDPMLTWGNYKIVSRGPHLGAVSGNFETGDENWEPGVHGGSQDKTFFDISMELCPDVAVIESEPVGFPRAPVGKRRVYVDLRNSMYIGTVNYDRRGEIWKSFEPSYSPYTKASETVLDGNHTAWSWRTVMSHDVQTNRMTRFVQAKNIRGGYSSTYGLDPEMYNKYLTIQAIRRLGR